jgi:hypothetical protein
MRHPIETIKSAAGQILSFYEFSKLAVLALVSKDEISDVLQHEGHLDDQVGNITDTLDSRREEMFQLTRDHRGFNTPE